jgi:8-oxo-dGTP pyrophosphatase MutT (NUDIX family)
MYNNITECGILLINYKFDAILVIFQKESSKWGLPKGHMENEELIRKDYFSCAKRELLEETGIMITTHKYRKIGTFVLKNKLFYVIQMLRNLNLHKPINNYEIGDIKWLLITQINNFTKTYNCNITLKELKTYLTNIYESHHKISNE